MTRVVLLSGGIDSTVALRLAARDESTIALVVDYGQKSRTELILADKLIRLYGSNRGLFVRCSLPGKTGLISGAVDHDRTLEEIGAPGDSPKAYTAGRNTVLLALALHVAECEGAGEIWIGANRDDQAGYPDCRRDYFDAFEAMCRVLGRSVRVRTPLIAMTKCEVVALGRDLGIDFTLTSSCYFGTECGSCDACVLRKHALGDRQ